MATEGDNAVGAVRKKLLDGGHHHNAAGEAQGIFDEGFVVVTRAAKAKLLESSRAIGQMARGPKADALEVEWKKVQAVVGPLLKPTPVRPRNGTVPLGAARRARRLARSAWFSSS